MARYKPSNPFSVPMFLYVPTTTTVKGTVTKTYPESGILIFGTFRTFITSQRNINDVVAVQDTATIETWYRPDITSDCKLQVNGVDYEIIGSPENINLRNQYLLIRVQAIQGGA